MKATSYFAGMKVQMTDIPEIYQTPRVDHSSYTWMSQDGSVENISDIDMMHLQNIYRVLVDTIRFAKKMKKHFVLAESMKSAMLTAHHHLFYIAYEIYRREHLDTIDNKYKITQS